MKICTIPKAIFANKPQTLDLYKIIHKTMMVTCTFLISITSSCSVMEIRIVLTVHVSVQTPLESCEASIKVVVHVSFPDHTSMASTSSSDIGLPQQATGPHETGPLTHIVGENCLVPME